MPITAVGAITVNSSSASVPRLVGGYGTHFALAARFLAPVELVSVVERDFGLDDFAVLAQQRLLTRWVRRRPTHERSETARGYSAALREAAMTVVQGASGVVYISGLAWSDQRLVADECRGAAAVAFDLGSDCDAPERADISTILDRANIVFLDGLRARSLTGATQFVGAGRCLQRLGADIVVLRLGEYGACIFADALILKVPAFPLLSAPESDGAGASFAGGFLGALAAFGGLATYSALCHALLCGTVTASFTIDAAGAKRSLMLTHDVLAERYDQLAQAITL